MKNIIILLALLMGLGFGLIKLTSIIEARASAAEPTLTAEPLPVGLQAAPKLTADYQFQNTRSSSIGTPPALTDLGSNTFQTDTVDGVSRTVLRFAENDGLQLSPTTGVIPNDRYTIVILFKFERVDGFRRVVDFKNGTSDFGAYILDGRLKEGGGNVPPNTYVQIVYTRDGSTVSQRGYIDGVLALQAPASDWEIDGSNTLRFFRDDNVFPGEASAGAVARLRLYDGPLTADQVAALDRLPASTPSTPTLSITDVSVFEGNSGRVTAVFTVILSYPFFRGWETTVNFATADGPPPPFGATAPGDYTSTSGTLTFPQGQGTAAMTVSVPVIGDSDRELDESFFINLSNATAGQGGSVIIGDGQAVGTILNDDGRPFPTLSIEDVLVVEGDGGGRPLTVSFTVRLFGQGPGPITVDFATADGTATVADNDYTSTSGTLTFGPNDATQPIVVVPFIGDTRREGDETFFVNLSNPVGAIIADGQGICTIVDDDGPPSFSIADVRELEHNAGTRSVIVTVFLSLATGSQVTVDFATADGTATIADSDYASTSGTLTFSGFGIGVMRSIQVPIIGDTRRESDETFFVNLSNPVGATIADGQGIGTIVDDDGPPTLLISDAVIAEGPPGATPNAMFAVFLSHPPPAPVTVDFATAAGTALNREDYSDTSGTLTFGASGGPAFITVPIIGDRFFEANEVFFVNLSNPVGASIARGEGVGAILNDDPPPILSISGVSMVEGNSLTRDAVFTVTVSVASQLPLSVDFATADATATVANNDYTSTSGTLTIQPGATGSLRVPIIGDTRFEADEAFVVNLSNPTDATIGDGVGIGVILNDDSGPTIASAMVSGKKLFVSGSGFDIGARILMDGQTQKTANDLQNPTTTVIAKKAGRKIGRGQTVTLQVRNSDGTLSNLFSFTRPAG